MRIYTPAPPEGGEWLTLQDSDPDQWEALSVLSGPVGSAWQAPQMSFIRQQEDGSPRRYSDCPWCLHSMLIVRDRALASLRPVLERYGEILPLRCDEPVSLFNATTILDALDEERSAIVRFDDGDLLAIERHVFRPDVIGNSEIFKLPVRASSIYLQEPVVRRIGELGLVGLAFDLVWTDEPLAPGETQIEYPGQGTRPPRS
jgi:hypothetical protein